ncbi:glutathione S-transferase family protein [Tatumella sp. UBA2305]|uniref:glutathione S-transferase family protein n=1 Tax=Tatumella sp. UBA2305 TaxID=1947647 RepID=UPI0025DDF7F2|nr:glutathione S-transferase family protein [Tatumella sp. UBA2305]
MKLIGMMDSPYVRRTAISLALYGISFDSLKLSVFSDYQAFSGFNPAVKAPTLLTDDGVRLVDSSLILQYFETLATPEKKLLPTAPAALARDTEILGTILMAAEKTVQYVYEHRLRPEEKQYQPWVERVTGQLLQACRVWESQIAGHVPSDNPDQVAVTGTVVWSFIQLMIPQVVMKSEFPVLQAIAEHYEAQPVFLRFPQ